MAIGVDMIPLSSAEAGSMHEVKWCIVSDPESREMLNNLGFTTGARPRVVQSVQGDVIVELNGARVALSRDVAERIKV